MIYLIAKGRFRGVKSIVLNSLEFKPFCVNLNDFDALLISSKNALNALAQSKSKLNLAISVYAVGDESAKCAKKMGFTSVKTPPKAYGKDLAKAYKAELKGKKCLYLRAEKIASNLPQTLINSGVDLCQIIAYQNIFTPPKKPTKLEKPAVFIFVSPSSVRNFLQIYTLDENDKCVAIGETTAATLPHNQSIFIPEKQSIKACVELARQLEKAFNFP